MFEIVVEGISELAEFVGSVLYSAPKGFRPVLSVALKKKNSFLELISCGYENPESPAK